MEKSERLEYYHTIMDRIDALKGWEKENAINMVILHGVLSAWDNAITLNVFKEMIEEELARMEK